MMGHHITFHASGNKVHVKWLQPPNEFAQLLDVVKAAMNAKHRTASSSQAEPIPPGPSSPADHVLATLQKLGELRDAGVVTPAEFEAEKAELLRRV